MNPKVNTINLTTVGQAILASEHVTLIVGPNNVGKSAILVGIHREIATEPGTQQLPVVGPVSSVVVQMPAADEFTVLINERAKLFAPGIFPQGTYYQPTFVFPNGTAIPQSVVVGLQSRSDRFGALAGSMMLLMGPEGRGGVLASQGLPDLMANPARSPMQQLWEDRELEKKIDIYMQRAFGRRLLVNRHAGANVHLHIGEVTADEPQMGVKSNYLDEVMKLPLLAAQGSGMLAFMGTILTLATGTYDIVLLDEPETFLHPPQARLLGEVVAEMSRDGGPQVIVATHSDDFVQGVINASKDDADVSVVRLTRPSDHENRVAQVDPDSIKSLYRDPLLRYSKIMDGIFYKGVVVCEAESDCTYYSATLGHVEDTDGLNASDLLFAQCGGKDRFKRAHQALDAAVPTAIVADIDILADKAKFQDLFEAMGGNFPSIQASYNVLESSVKNHSATPERAKVRTEMRAVLDGSADPHFAKSELDRIGELIKSESGWRQIKRKGAGAIDTGDPTAAFNSILAASKLVGLFILPVGELERFHSDVSGNKQEWLRKVLEQELFRTSQEAHDLMREVREFVAANQ